MTSPDQYLIRIGAFLAAVLLLALLLSVSLATAFAANPLLNGLILAVLLLGIAWNLRQVMLLRAEVAWVEAFSGPRGGARAPEAPRLLAPMASMFAARATERISLSAPVMRGVLDGIASRLDESRELSRYATGLLVFLGLLGTFWGLLVTVGAVSAVIGEMNLAGGDAAAMFDQLKAGLARPLAGMAIAFSSSMLGLAGALVLGFLDLTAGQAQARFYQELEEWLAARTRVGGAGAEGDASLAAVAEQMAETLEAFQLVLARQTGTEAALGAIQATLARIADDLPQGRAHATAELVAEVRALSRTIADLAEAERR